MSTRFSFHDSEESSSQHDRSSLALDEAVLWSWAKSIKLVGYGIDTLILNVRYTNKQFEIVQQQLDRDLAQQLDDLQHEARSAETAVASPWSFQNVLLFVEPHGAGKQWRWLLTCRLLTLVISRGTFGDLIAQVRFSSEYLWSQAGPGDALYHVHDFLMSIFGEYIHLQVSEVHLCADMVGYDFSLANYHAHFITRAKKQGSIYGTDEVRLDHRTVSTLSFSNHGSPISCTIYDKTREIRQKSGKTWFYDLWRRGVEGPYGGTWDGSSPVWRVEFRFKRDFLHCLTTPIEHAYDVLEQLQPLWSYAAGRPEGDSDGFPDGWLRYIIPTEDENRSRWPVHPAWAVVQMAFVEDPKADGGTLVRYRVREKNLERGVAAMIGYASTLAAWLGGTYAASSADVSLTLQWLYEAGMQYLEEKERDFSKEVRKKQERYGSEHIEQEVAE